MSSVNIATNKFLGFQESVDTPMPERRKSSNWLSRQISRMGSLRSSSTAYSSGLPFKRNRHNSVYSSPDNELPAQQLRPTVNNKMKMYDKFPRKSARNLKNMLRRGKLMQNFAPIHVFTVAHLDRFIFVTDLSIHSQKEPFSIKKNAQNIPLTQYQNHHRHFI